jgi:Zn-dependent protease with chaperone function
MENFNVPFPPMPIGADDTIIKPSKSFTKQVYYSIGSILLFVTVYFLLFFGALAIAAAFCLLGYAIFNAHISFISFIAGIGFIGAGFMLVFFLIKFLFKRTHTDYSGKFELTESDQPELFAFINKLTIETKAPKPKRIFITADVNAGVFYSSSFWSMFFPVKKNLQIGLGLVNTVNISEFKAVMAHEFGHFSQRSMKFGSYVYNLNKVIYNMLFDNDSYGKLLNTWARMHAVFRLMAWININLIKGIQFILKEVYVIVNKTYLGLSREMEFHADAVAAYVSGSNHVITSLKRIEIGQICYSSLIEYWNLKLGKNERSLNFYPQHLEVIRHFADEHDLVSDAYGLPLINKGLAVIGSSQISIDDQWSSHPSTEDRESHLQNTNLETITLNEPAWLLFRNPEQLQLQLTDQTYLGANTNTDTRIIGLADFKADFYKTINSNSFNEEYKGYFDDRIITQFDINDAIILSGKTEQIAFEDLFSTENCGMPKAVTRMQQDIALLDQIIEIRKDIKTFDYKGTKYKRDSAADLQADIEKERKQTQTRIEALDKNVFIYFYGIVASTETREQLVNKYRNLFKYQTDAVKDFDMYDDMMRAINPIYSKMTPINIMNTLDVVYATEKKLKPRLKEIIADVETRTYITDERLKALEYYINAKLIYYYEPTYDKRSIAEFNRAMDAYISSILKRNFEIKKDLLNFQISIMRDKN